MARSSKHASRTPPNTVSSTIRGKPKRRVMWIESKAGGLAGPARIGWVVAERNGKRLRYGDRTFSSLRGEGYKSNYFDVETREKYWITGCRKDGRNALYNTTVEIDEDAREEYWLRIRGEPEKLAVRCFRALGKY